MCVIDLDGFKGINDHFCHHAGDVVLRVVAQRVQAVLRSTDTVARLGGDEFVVLLAGHDRDIAMAEVIGRVIERVARPIDLGSDGRCVNVTASIGVAFAARASDVDSLIREADSAMYEAKSAGKGCYRVFGPGQPSARPAAECQPG